MSDRFDVFISYSRRADEPLAEALQRDLQRFAKRAFQRRALHVFRDDGNLSANPGLWSSIVAALDASRFLLVLASPAAAASPWVAKELEHWRATHPPGQLLLAVTEGEVVWDTAQGDFDLARSSAIPRALAGAFDEEPRFVDLRSIDETQVLSRRDPGFSAAVADLAAPVHGRSKDELVGEDLHQHRRLIRLTRTAVGVLAVLLTVAVVAGLLAFVQRNQAQRAAADAEHRRLANAAATATTRQDAIALALAALPSAARSGRDEAEALRPLIGALARIDLPELRLSGRAPGQASSGERQGVDVSLDGTTLAFITNTGDIDLWDLTTLRRRSEIPAAEAGGVAAQLGLDLDGSRLAVVAFPAQEITGLEPVTATLTTFDVSGTTATDARSDEVSLRSASAVAFGPDDDTVLVMENEGSLVVVNGHGADLIQTPLGQATATSNAGFVVTGFSTDGRRACSLGDQELQVYDVDPPQLLVALPPPPGASDGLAVGLAPLGSGAACLPEPCGGSADSFAAVAPRGALHCYEPDGTDVTSDATPALESSSVYAGLLDATEFNSQLGWRVTPPADGWPVAMVKLPETVARSLVSDIGNEAGLMGSRLVRAGAGYGVLTLDTDGVIQLWRVSDGAVRPASWDEQDRVARTLLAVPGSSDRAGSVALQVDLVAPGGPAEVVDMKTGETIGSWDASPPPLVSDARGAPVALRQTADGQVIVEVLDDGTVLRRDVTTGRATTLAQLEVSRPLPAEEVDLSDGRLAFLDGATASVVDLGDGRVIARHEVSGDSCASFPTIPRESAYVDLSDDGRSLAVVRCAGAGLGTLSTFADVDQDRAPVTAPLRYRHPTTVSIADRGGLVAVASTTGQIGIRHGERWIEPAALQAERAAHNDFQVGWVAVSPDGALIVTSRDATNVELWARSGSTVERVTALVDGDAQLPPAFARFDPDQTGVTIAWPTTLHYDTLTQSAVAGHWSLTRDFLVDEACQELADAPAGAAAQGVTERVGCRPSD